VRKRPLQDLVPRHGELGAASHSNLFWHGSGIEQFRPSLSKGSLGRCFVFVYTCLLFLVAKRLYLCRVTAWSCVTPEVCVSVLLYKIYVEQLQCFRGVLVIVPGAEMAVYEGDGLREMVVMFNDVRKIGIRFSSFVSCCM
jgi:hypothetical protein